MLPCFTNAGEMTPARRYEFSVKFWQLFLILFGLPACEVITPNLTPLPNVATPFQDAADMVRGICFEAAFDSARQGQVFVLRDTEAQIAFYDLADNSQLCRRPVERVPFDFSGGRVVAGLWSTGVGCTAAHEVLETRRDDNAKTVVLRLQFVIEGDCLYELVRPFWVAIDGANAYEIAIEVE